MMIGPGSVLGGYRIERVLGSGGMGTVYLAAHPVLPRNDALKVLWPHLATDPEFRARFEREANLAAALDHPNIVAVQNRGEEQGCLWIALQYVRGTDAATALATTPAGLPPVRALRIITEIGKGLDHAHRNGMLHRDVKPANFLLAAQQHGEERVLLADFGVAKPTGDATQLTRTGTFVATVAYASPEQLSGGPLNSRSDVYSLGASWYRLLTGQNPYPGAQPITVMMGHLHDPPPRITALRSDLPPALDDVLARVLAKDPAHRYSTCLEFTDAAAAALAGASLGSLPESRLDVAGRQGAMSPTPGVRPSPQSSTAASNLTRASVNPGDTTEVPARATLSPARVNSSQAETVENPASKLAKTVENPASNSAETVENPASKPARTVENPAQTAMNPAQKAVNPARSASDPEAAGSRPGSAAVSPARATVNPARTAINPARTANDRGRIDENAVETAAIPARAAADSEAAGSKLGGAALSPARATVNPARTAFDPARTADDRGRRAANAEPTEHADFRSVAPQSEIHGRATPAESPDPVRSAPVKRPSRRKVLGALLLLISLAATVLVIVKASTDTSAPTTDASAALADPCVFMTPFLKQRFVVSDNGVSDLTPIDRTCTWAPQVSGGTTAVIRISSDHTISNSTEIDVRIADAADGRRTTPPMKADDTYSCGVAWQTSYGHAETLMRGGTAAADRLGLCVAAEDLADRIFLKISG